ncbi:MAG: protein-glutamate O-methyltransferase CheR [Gammaproteobacteria bacterium]|nr:protein-glutamate O-methyltransferase CheR [Gammaproteobacteria bacterium]
MQTETMPMNSEEEYSWQQDFELDLFVQAIRKSIGVDLANYAKASLRRRVQQLVYKQNVSFISELLPPIIHDVTFAQFIINELTVNVSELFRNPDVFASLLKNVFPVLASYSRIDIWVAGCSCGEEAYSLVILLDEAGLLERTQIHATDINIDALCIANSGLLQRPLDRNTAQRYRMAGGNKSLANYFSSAYKETKLSERLLKHVSFNQHDLTQEQGFTSPQLIMCRNVMIYFNQTLQDKVLASFYANLIPNGFLVIGPKESLGQSLIANKLEIIDKDNRIYKR